VLEICTEDHMLQTKCYPMMEGSKKMVILAEQSYCLQKDAKQLFPMILITSCED